MVKVKASPSAVAAEAAVRTRFGSSGATSANSRRAAAKMQVTAPAVANDDAQIDPPGDIANRHQRRQLADQHRHGMSRCVWYTQLGARRNELRCVQPPHDWRRGPRINRKGGCEYEKSRHGWQCTSLASHDRPAGLKRVLFARHISGIGPTSP